MGVTLVHFFDVNSVPRNIVGCALSAPDGSSPRGYSQKMLFSSIGSKCNVDHHTSIQDTFNFEILQLRDTLNFEVLQEPLVIR
jgi:hypothetical protein